MIQQIIVIVFFAAAVAYTGWLVFRSFRTERGCATGCGKCGAIDIASIEKQIREKGI